MSENKGDDEALLEKAIGSYISFAEYAYEIRKPWLVVKALDIIREDDYDTEVDYYASLANYIAREL